MAGFCKAIQEECLIQMDDLEIQEVKKGVDVLMRRFMKALQDSYPSVNIVDVQACGSMEDGTRVREPNPNKFFLEFDYLAVLKSWPGYDQLKFKHSCAGTMNVLHNVQFCDVLPTSSHRLEYIPTHVKNCFRMNLVNVINANCQKHLCAKYRKCNEKGEFQNILYEFERPFGCVFCTTHTENGYMYGGDLIREGVMPKMRFLWVNVNNKPETNVNPENVLLPLEHSYTRRKIEVDFHPVILVNQDNILPSSEPLMDKNLQYYLFPKSFRYPCLHSQCWGLSVYLGELQILQGSSEVHRAAYGVLKYLTSENFYSKKPLFNGLQQNTIGSYEVKTAVLYHIAKCGDKTRSLIECTTDILDILASSYVDVNLQHYFLQYNLLSKEPSLIYQRTGYILRGFRDMLRLNTTDTSTECPDIDLVAATAHICRKGRIIDAEETKYTQDLSDNLSELITMRRNGSTRSDLINWLKEKDPNKFHGCLDDVTMYS